jgi:RNA polymerase sigma factor (TIGR02999 family)
MKIRSRAYTRLVAEPVERTTRLLQAAERGDPGSEQELFEVLYEDLKRVAGRLLAQERASHTLQATALVHEAYVRLVGDAPEAPWDGRGHFFAAAAEAMRRILVDQARRKRSQRAGGDWPRIELSQVDPEIPGPQLDLLALDEALQRLATRDPRAAELVKLRFFGGLTVPEAATVLGVSVATAENDWAYAKSWLKLQLSPADREPH